MIKAKAFIFDMDGVIFDSERLYLGCCTEAAEVFGIDNIEEVVYRCIGLTTEKTHEMYRSIDGDDFPFQGKGSGGAAACKGGRKRDT